SVVAYGIGDATSGHSIGLIDWADEVGCSEIQVVTNSLVGYGTGLYRWEGTNGQHLFFDSLSSGLSGQWYAFDPNNNNFAGAGLRSEERRIGNESAAHAAPALYHNSPHTQTNG